MALFDVSQRHAGDQTTRELRTYLDDAHRQLMLVFAPEPAPPRVPGTKSGSADE